MKYFLIIAFLAAVVGLEVFHALSSGSGNNSKLVPAEAGGDAIRDVVLDHSKGH